MLVTILGMLQLPPHLVAITHRSHIPLKLLWKKLDCVFGAGSCPNSPVFTPGCFTLSDKNKSLNKGGTDGYPNSLVPIRKFYIT